MEQLILIVFVLVSAAMIGLILLQQGKGADMGASFGSGSSQTMFGPAGSGNVLTRTTAILATLFFIGCFALAIVARDNAQQVDDGMPVPALVESAEQAAPSAGAEAAGEIPVAEDAAAPAGEDIPDVPKD